MLRKGYGAAKALIQFSLTVFQPIASSNSIKNKTNIFRIRDILAFCDHRPGIICYKYIYDAFAFC